MASTLFSVGNASHFPVDRGEGTIHVPRMGKRGFWMRLVLATVSGLMVAGLFAPYNVGVMAWLAMIPFLAAAWSVEGKWTGWKGFGWGWWAGSVSWLVQLSWLGTVSWLGAVVLPLYLAIYWGIFGAFAATLANPNRHSRLGPVGIAFATAAVWAGLEVLRGWVFTGFGWNGLGVALHQMLPLAQAADVLGVAGLSLVLVFCQVLVLLAVRGKNWRHGALVVVVVALLAGYGFLRISLEHRADSFRLRALLVQLNIPQDAAHMLWSSEEVHMAYEEETLKGLEANRAQWPDWVVWPETALTGRILMADDGTWGTWRENLETISQIRQAGPFHLIYGVNELEADKRGDQVVMKPNARAYNSMAVMSPDDDLQTFRKHHLVIFGETIPFVDSMPWLKKIYEEQSGTEYGGSFTAGISTDPLPIITRGKSIGAIPTVCFEDTVPRLTRQFVRSGPQVIVNVTNDGWFKQSVGAAQHFANAKFRAIELHRPMLRSANTGISAAIDSTGSTKHPETGAQQTIRDASGSHFTRGSRLVELDVPLEPSFSLYAKMGDAGILILSAIGLLLAISLRRNPDTQRVA